jgi:hypothetical protein
LWGGTFGKFCPKNKLKLHCRKKTDFSKIFQTRKKLDSESTDFLFRFFLLFENMADFPPFFKKKSQVSYISHFSPKTFHKIKKNSPQKKTVGAILPKARPILV